MGIPQQNRAVCVQKLILVTCRKEGIHPNLLSMVSCLPHGFCCWQEGAQARLVGSQAGAINAVALASPGGSPTAYCAGHTATLKIYTLGTGSQVENI